ncbi:MAG: NADPH-dependent F420 reductase [Flexilinea sp.]
MTKKIAIIGNGNVGNALAEGLRRGGHEIRFSPKNRQEESLREVSVWGDVVILAVPWGAYAEISKTLGNTLNDKVVVDVSNVMTPNMELAIGFTTSGAEELQKMIPKAKVVKAFNTVFSRTMSTGKVLGEQLTVLVAGDDPDSKATVRKLAEDIGFDSVDAGPLKSARYLESLGMLNIFLGFGQKLGNEIGFKLVKKAGG